MNVSDATLTQKEMDLIYTTYRSKSGSKGRTIHLYNTVLRIGMFIPDPTFSHPGSASKKLSILTPKKWFLSSRKYDLGCSSGIRMQAVWRAGKEHLLTFFLVPVYK